MLCGCFGSGRGYGAPTDAHNTSLCLETRSVSEDRPSLTFRVSLNIDCNILERSVEIQGQQRRLKDGSARQASRSETANDASGLLQVQLRPQGLMRCDRNNAVNRSAWHQT